MARLKFMHGLRVETYLSPKSRPKVDKDANKLVQLFFVTKMTAPVALACDQIIQRAFEDCEDLERKIDKVALRVDVPNTDVDVFPLRESTKPGFRLDNVTIEGLACERVEGATYLYFSTIVPQNRKGFWLWYGEAYNHTLFLEFKRSQFALGTETEESSGSVVESMAKLVKPVADPESGITSMSFQVQGEEPVVITRETAQAIQDAASESKRKRSKS